MAAAKIHWHDDYILANWQNHRNWLSLNRAYNKEYDEDIGYNTFKSHCHRLGLDFHYSPEQQEWLKEMYPKHGRTVTTKLFNERFRENKSEYAVKNKCIKMGLTVTEERKKEIAIENTKRFHKIGTLVVKQHGEPYVKTERGWKRLKNIVYGDVPKGKILVHLNGDPTDCNINNLYPISKSINARMTANKFWSENPTITKTGILCCELEELLYLDEGEEEWE